MIFPSNKTKVSGSQKGLLIQISSETAANNSTMALVTKSAVSQKAAFAGRVAPVRPQVVGRHP